MNKIFSLCINLLLLMISDAVPLKLIAGDRSVVKKDGATHTISKYYVVPNDYDPNNVTDTTAATQKSSLRMYRGYSKSMNSGSVDEEISENKAKTVNHQLDDDDDGAGVTVEKINDQVNFRLDLNVGQGQVTNQPNDSTPSTVSMSTEQTLDSDDLGNLQVVPIINPVNISHIVTNDEIDTNANSGEAVQKRSGFIVDNVTDHQIIEDAIDDLILSKFGIAVRDIYSQNLESFWKLIKVNYIDKELGDDELLAAIEQVSVLLNIFKNLYEAVQKQQPVEKMIDGIVEILQKPFVEKSNRDESQAETNISGVYDEECLRKCGQRSFKPQLDSNSTYLSEPEASDSLEQEILQRRQIGNSDSNDLSKMSDNPDSNQVTVSNESTNVVRGQLPVLYNLNVGVPDRYRVRSSMTTPTLNSVVRYNDIQEDPNSIQNTPNSTETVKNLDDQPVTVESGFVDGLPLTIKSRTADDLPSTIEDEKTEYFPWPIPTTPNDSLPWHIEDKTNGYHPLTIEHGTSNKVPWNIESGTAPTWTVVNKMGHLPITTLYQSSDPSITTYGSNILLNPNQSIKSTVHSVKNGIKKPYHIYTYVIKPTATLQKVPNGGNVYENLKTTLYGRPTSHDGNQVVFKNQPTQSHHESHYSVSKPTHEISIQPSYSQLTHHVTTTYDQSHEVNPSTLHSQTPQEDNEPQNFVGHGSKPNHKPALLQSNTHPSESQPNSGEEKEISAVPEIDSPPGYLLKNIPSNSLDEPIYGGQVYLQPGVLSTASPNSKYTIVQNNNNVPTQVHGGDTNNNPGYIDKPVYGGQVYQQPGALSTASANSKYTIVQNNNDVPTQAHGGDKNNIPGYIDESVNGGQVYQQPSALFTASANSKYTTVQNNNDVSTQVHGGDTNNYPGYINEPVNGEQVYQQPGALSTASANSKYTIVQNNNDVPTQVHGGDTNNYPGYIDEPVYGGQVYQQPGALSTASANSKYTIVQNDNDVPTQVHGGDTNNNPGYIDESVNGGQEYQIPGALFTASADSKYTTIQNNNDVSSQVHGGDTNNYPGYIDKPVYGGQVYQQPGALSTASANSKYTIVQNSNDVPIQVHGGDTNNYPGYIGEPVYGGQVYQQPGALSTASANSKFTIVQNNNDVPTQAHAEDTNNDPGYISKATAHSEYTNVPFDYGHDTNTQPGLISEFHQHLVYPKVVNDFDASIPVKGVQIQKQSPINGGPAYNKDYLVPYQPYGHKVHVIYQPTISGNQNLKLAPTYRLFTLQNLQNLENAIIKTIQMNGPGFYDGRVLVNLRKIINVILLLAENLKGTDGTNAWYEKIFYNSENNQHPLQHYVYNLIRQRWLHELMFLLYKNNFSINILQNPGMFSFLESWKFPEYVQNFMKKEQLMHVPNSQNYNDISNNQNYLQHKFSIHTYDDLLESPVDLTKYVTKNVIDSYKSPNKGIVLSIAGVEGEPDAKAIINILQNYLQNKNYIETQENVINRDNKVEMLKKIILFLREKGYGPNTIADLIRKLYTVIYSTEGRDCKTRHTNFTKNMYDVILPVLRRSGR